MKAVRMWVLLSAMALLAACATQREAPPQEQAVAPSEQVLTEEEPTPEAGMEEAAPDETPAQQPPGPQDAQPREEVAALQPEAGPAQPPPAEEEPAVEPIVPAFPQRAQTAPVSELERVHFPFDSSDLTDEARAALNRNASWLKAHPNVRVRIEGHCDERGTSEYNLALGQRRALRVRDYLIDAGVDAARMVTVSYGEEVPLVRGHDEKAYRQNRRAEFSSVDS